MWAIILWGQREPISSCILTSMARLTKVSAAVFGIVHFVMICAGARFCRSVEFPVAGAPQTRDAARERVKRRDESIVRTENSQVQRSQEDREGGRKEEGRKRGYPGQLNLQFLNSGDSSPLASSDQVITHWKQQERLSTSKETPKTR